MSSLLALLALTACPEDGKDILEPGDPLQITTTSLPLASIGVAYNAGVDAEGGNGEYSWNLESGSLLPGLALSVEDLTDDDLVITGIPETAGSFTFELQVESEDDQSRTRSYTLTVLEEPAAIAVTTSVLPPALVGAALDTRLAAVGGDGAGFSWTVESGTLPAGLTLEANGRLHGTPTVADTVALLFAVESGGFEATRTLTLQIVGNITNAYNITVVPVVPIPAGLQASVDAAIDRLEAAITGDLSSIQLATGTFSGSQCGGFGSIVNGTSTDDLILLVNIAPIDGPNQVLGFAGPCLIRQSNDLPIVGILTLDVVDLGFLSAPNQVALVMHETGHVLGFGSLWESAGFDLVSASTTDPRFTGSAGNAQWTALGGTGGAPVEDEGGQGTARSHWREDVFGPELMTGFANTNVFQPFSRMSVASFQDMGYTVNVNAGDAYTVPNSPPIPGSAAAAVAGYDVVVDMVIGAVADDGRFFTLRREDR